MNDWELTLYNRALNRWGVGRQVLMFVEECGEGIVAACKINREINGIPERQFVEELADISIMVEQMRLVFDQEGAFDGIREEKLQRLESYLEKPCKCPSCGLPNRNMKIGCPMCGVPGVSL